MKHTYNWGKVITLTVIFVYLLIIMIIFLKILLVKRDTVREIKALHHYCKLGEDCPYYGEEKFTHGCGLCTSNSQCRDMDSIHFANPAIDYREDGGYYPQPVNFLIY